LQQQSRHYYGEQSKAGTMDGKNCTARTAFGNKRKYNATSANDTEPRKETWKQKLEKILRSRGPA
jgi:hypothetical protein